MSSYRTHTCGELKIDNNDENVVLSGWINKKRDHGNLLFLDLRDNYGITQCVIEKNNLNFKTLEKLSLESVIKISGKVVKRSGDTINKEIETGETGETEREVVVKVWVFRERQDDGRDDGDADADNDRQRRRHGILVPGRNSFLSGN